MHQEHTKLHTGTKKNTREFQVLLGVVELYLESGKPIGSNTLKEHGFGHLSSATIRNYFAKLEKEGFLRQPHSSGGRIPTHDALKLYAKEYASESFSENQDLFRDLSQANPRHLSRFLQTSAESLSEICQLATFLTAVRFDHDFILDVKLVGIDMERVLCVMVTDFGQILTEVLHLKQNMKQKLSSLALKRIESYLQWRLKGQAKSHTLSPEEEETGQAFYNEIMIRYIVRYTNFSNEDLFRTGFAQLLTYPEFSDPLALATGLSLFENPEHMRLLLNDCVRSGQLCYWIGRDLSPYTDAAQGCSVIAIPYYIGQMKVGAVGVLGPCRIPYKKIFQLLNLFSTAISKALTGGLMKHKLSFRQARSPTSELRIQHSQKLLEIKELT
jgi:heat-inducible transcriptional repressor